MDDRFGTTRRLVKTVWSSASFKLTLKLAGMALSLLGLIFLLAKLDWTNFSNTITTLGALRFFAASLFYAFSLFLLAYIWVFLLPRAALQSRNLLFYVRIYARSVLTKYIPSGIFQYLSRQIDIIDEEISQTEAAKASLSEIGLQIAASGFLIAVGLSLPGNSSLVQAHYGAEIFSIAIAGFLAIAVSLAGLVFAMQGKKTAFAFLLNFLFFSIASLLSAWVASPFLPALPISLLVVIFTLSWLAGFVVIGSSGGLGIREGAIIFLLYDIVDAETAASVALLLRLMTSLGDGFFSLFFIVNRGRI